MQISAKPESTWTFSYNIAILPQILITAEKIDANKFIVSSAHPVMYPDMTVDPFKPQSYHFSESEKVWESITGRDFDPHFRLEDSDIAGE